jgi:hypothetical protein
MKKSIEIELRNYIEDHLNYNDYHEDLHHELFNQDYYIIGYYKAEKWLKNHGLSVFEGIEICNQFELENFGEIQNTFTGAEKLVNHLAYWYGQDLCNEFELIK